MDNSHSGHRERLRQKFLANGTAAMPQHQILELLLFYAIPRSDTNDLAHRLIARFGSLNGVFDADIDELMDVQGLGKNAAVLLKLMPQVAQIYFSSTYDGIRLCSTRAIGTFLRFNYNNADTEILRLLCFDDSLKIRYNIILANGDDSEVAIDQKLIMQRLLNSGCNKCALVHNHPGCSSRPSEDDIIATKALQKSLKASGITLIDHFIIGDDGVTAIINGGFCEGIG